MGFNLEVEKMTDKDMMGRDVRQAREIIVGKTWLKLQLMQGSTMVCHHSRGKHYAQVGNKTITEIHPSEASLVEEFEEYHGFTFRDLKCESSIGDMDYLKTEWKWRLFTAAPMAKLRSMRQHWTVE